MKVEHREQRQQQQQQRQRRRRRRKSCGELQRGGREKLSSEYRSERGCWGGGGSGEFKVGEDRDGERKGEQEGERGAEYSAAVSRLADSGCSCSECGMRGRRKKTAVKRAKGDGAEKERTSACMGEKKKCIQMCVGLYSGVFYARVHPCRSARVSFPSLFCKRVERPASEENSIFSCSYACCKSSGWDVQCIQLFCE